MRKNKNIGIVGVLIGLMLLGYKSIETDEKEYQENTGFYVHYLDVNQGDSTLIQSKEDGIVALIDGGERAESKKILEYLDKLGIDKINYLVASHPHSDHIGGLIEIIENIEVENIIMPDKVHTTKTFENFIEAIEKKENINIIVDLEDEYIIGKSKVKILKPNEKNYTNINNYSIIMQIDYLGSTFLFTGDGEKLVEESLVKIYGNDLKSDVLKVSHHGSRTSSTKGFLDKVDPMISVIFAKENNRYNLPNKEIEKKLKKISEVYRTDINGDIIIRTNGNKEFSIESSK